jgi:hypothetical protein
MIGRDNELFWTEKFIVPAGHVVDHLVGAGDERRRDGKESRARDVKTLCALAARQPHREDRALARFAGHRHVAAHHARELAGNSET